jgi:hypothetical protein
MCKLRRQAKEATRFAREDAFLVGIFNNHKTETFGYQGTGKDLLTSHAVRLIGRPYYSNIRYDGNATLFDLKDLNAGGNTYQDLINGTVKKFPRKFADGRHKYISDCGIYLPSQYYKDLEGLYPGMPVEFALHRQLYDSQIHINSQDIDRPWTKLTEQIDVYLNTLGVRREGDCLFIKYIYYTKYDSARRGLLPLPHTDGNGGERDAAQFYATYGEISEHEVRMRIRDVEYDTRYFRDALFLDEREQQKYKPVRIHKYDD